MEEYSARNRNIEISQLDWSVKCIAFLGEIDLHDGLSFYRTYPRSVNIEKFLKFLKELRKHYKDTKICIYMDKLAVHTS